MADLDEIDPKEVTEFYNTVVREGTLEGLEKALEDGSFVRPWKAKLVKDEIARRKSFLEKRDKIIAENTAQREKFGKMWGWSITFILVLAFIGFILSTMVSF